MIESRLWRTEDILWFGPCERNTDVRVPYVLSKMNKGIGVNSTYLSVERVQHPLYERVAVN